MGGTKPVVVTRDIPEWFGKTIKEIARREIITEILIEAKDKNPDDIILGFAREMKEICPEHANNVLEKYETVGADTGIRSEN